MSDRSSSTEPSPPELPYADAPTSNDRPAPNDQSPPLDAVADGIRRQLDPAWVTASRLRALFGTLILSGILGTVAAVSAVATEQWLLAGGAWLLGTSLLLVRAIVWPALEYRYAAYAVTSHGLRIRRGVLIRSIVSVPKSRVQHTDVSQGPLQRRFGLSTLTVHTAGTQFAAVPLPGIRRDTALAIRNYLIDDEDDEDDGV